MSQTILLSLVFGVLVTEIAACSEDKYRLSGVVKPSFYTIKIRPNFDEETFKGEVTIHLKAETSVESIEFHSSGLEIDSFFFDTQQIFQTTSDSFGYEFCKFDLVRIFRSNELYIPPGNHVVHVKYSGNFSKTTEGIFKTGFTIDDETLSYLVATDFQPSRARQVFPSFDEPSFKARYQLDVVVPNNSYVALSNMRETFQVSEGIVYKFEPTPLMSVYLLSFVVTQHTYIEYVDDQIPYRIYSYNVSQNNDTKLLEFASKVLRFYSDYTNFNYTLPKIDFIDFDRKESAGTENWGLITVRTGLLSSEDGVYTVSQKRSVIAHELAHFWFGNLVTNAWWDDIWLQESVATFMSIKAEESVLKNQALKSFPFMYMENLFWLEYSENSTPVVHFQESPVEVRKNFNSVTYIKGAAILHMAQTVIGEENMMTVLREYVEKFAFNTVTTDDVLSILESQTDEIFLREFLETYLYQSKFPVIDIEEKEDEYVLKQISLPEIPSDTNSPFDSKWTIPVTYVTSLNKTPALVWLSKDMENVVLPNKNVSWVKLNYGQLGYYRVRYSERMWEMLIEHNQELEPFERLYLLSEAIYLYDLKLYSCDTIIKYFLGLPRVSLFVADVAYTFYTKLNTVLKKYDQEASNQLTVFIQNILSKSGAKPLVKRSSEEAENSTEHLEKKLPQHMEHCVEWLKSAGFTRSWV